MVVEETIDLLFAKNASFVRSEKPAGQQKEASPAAPAPGPVSEIKVGEIKLRGKVQLPQRKVVLEPAHLQEMRRNLALFSN